VGDAREPAPLLRRWSGTEVHDGRKEGLDDEELEQEVGVPLPERDAMSLIDPSVAKAALSDFATGTVPAQGDAANAAATPTPDKVGGGNVESS